MQLKVEQNNYPWETRDRILQWICIAKVRLCINQQRSDNILQESCSAMSIEWKTNSILMKKKKKEKEKKKKKKEREEEKEGKRKGNIKNGTYLESKHKHHRCSIV